MTVGGGKRNETTGGLDRCWSIQQGSNPPIEGPCGRPEMRDEELQSHKGFEGFHFGKTDKDNTQL